MWGGFAGTRCPAPCCVLSSGQKAGVAVGYTQTPSLAWSSPCKVEQRVSYRLPSTGCSLPGWSQKLHFIFPKFIGSSSPLIASFFINSLLIFITTCFSFPFFLSLPLFSHPLFSIFYLLHPSLCQQRGRIDFPSPPPSCSQNRYKPGSELAGANCKCVTIKITKFFLHFGTKGVDWKPVSSPTCFRGHPGLEGLFFPNTAQNWHLLQRK